MTKIRDGILGLVLGDALGVPYEFRQRGTFLATGMRGWGTHFQPPGTWSDDSSMTLATLDWLTFDEGLVVCDDIMDGFSDWYFFGEYTPHGEVFDIGGTTLESILNYSSGINADRCGMDGERDCGNGSLMRILPLAYFDASDGQVRDVSALTHAHEIAVQGCQIYVKIAKMLLEGKSPKEAIKKTMLSRDWHKEYSRIEKIDTLKKKDIISRGYVVSTLEAALWSLVNSKSYMDCVLKAINLGGDTDTIAAVAGGLAGIVYGVGGFKGIPKSMIRRLARIDYIESLCRDADNVRYRKGK